MLLADRRAEHIVTCAVANLRNAYEVDLKARYMLHAAIWGHPTDRHIRTGLGGVNTGGASDDTEAGPASSTNEDDHDVASKLATYKLLTSRSLSEEERAARARKAIAPGVLNAINNLYSTGVASFPSSPILHLFAARFDSCVRNNKVRDAVVMEGRVG